MRRESWLAEHHKRPETPCTTQPLWPEGSQVARPGLMTSLWSWPTNWRQNTSRPAKAAGGAPRIAQGILATADRLLAVAGVLSRPNLGREACQVPAPPAREMVE